MKRVTGLTDYRVIGQIWGIPVAVWLATLAVFLLRVGYVQFWHPYGLAPDEAQYWTWLSHNDWSFLTKPPLTTWLMGVSTFVLGDTLLGVKFFALVGQGAVSLLGFLIAKEIAGDKAGNWAWALLTTVPLIAAGGLLMSPDAVLLPLWMGAVLCVVRGLRNQEPGTKEPKDRGLCWGRWVIIGVLIGLGGLAKYSAGVFYPLLGMYLLIWKREWLLKPQVWVSGLVALAMQAPVVLWNFQHDWVGVAHVLWQAGGGEDGRHSGLKSLGEFLGGQALVLGPVVFLLMGVGLYRVMAGYVGSSREQVRWLVWVSGVILGGFAVLSFTTKVQANWPVLGAVVGVVGLAVWLGRSDQLSVTSDQEKRSGHWICWIALVGIVVNAGLSLVLMDTYKARDLGILPLKAKNDPTKDLRGWEEMGNLVGLLMYKLDNPVILSSRYQTLAPLMFHTIGRPEFAYINAEGKRLNEYDVWPMPSLEGRLVVYVNEQGYLPPKVKEMFGECAPWHTLGVEEYGITTRKLSLWVCWGGGAQVAAL